MSPSMEKMPSVTMSLPAPSGSFASCLSRSFMSLWLYRSIFPWEIWHPSTMEAWLILSERMYCPRWTRVEMTPVLVWNPVGKISAASLPTRSASRRSTSRWMGRVPLRNRDPEQPVPYLWMASMERALTCGCVVSSR